MHEGHRQRLLTKVLKDCSYLEDHEILEALLFYAIPRKNTNEIAKNLLTLCGDLKTVFKTDKEILMTVDGVGPSVAAYITLLSSVFETYSKKEKPVLKFRNLQNVSTYLVKALGHLQTESFVTYLLDGCDKLITTYSFTSDSNKKVSIDLPALSNALAVNKPKAILIAHNHPSGNCLPSIQDDSTTRKIYLMAKLNDITLYDHIIVAEDRFFSYYKSGKLDKIKENVDLSKDF